ncbi:protein mono-ADP-ribosyltransferase PARP16-like isoform X2 [Branchiostoma floridae]|uniref:Poly [ADP-ribose] polymerase n=1 Tax=Branchiostoma floridae TaxID=7739 RepID=A0A9J7KP84_BRAFL|nr:protein mono-ADP-ribosyltransferase PARP16-like isoform X2 [Branchiostoma floridae]
MAEELLRNVREKLEGDLLAADLQLSLFAAALLSYRHDTVLRPFPPGFARQNDEKDFPALKSVWRRLPGAKDLLQSSGATSDPQTLQLVNWVLETRNFCLRSCESTEYKEVQRLTGYSSTNIPPPSHIFEVVHSETTDARFEETRQDRSLLYAFHGSRLDNFYSILHNGLHAHLNKNSLFGEGTYLSGDLGVSIIYSHKGQGWDRSMLGETMSCVAVCEVIMDPKYVKSKVEENGRAKNKDKQEVPEKYYIVSNNELLRVKYVLVYAEKKVQQRVQTPSFFQRHKFFVLMSLYVVVLAVIGAANSPNLQYYLRRLYK